VGAQSHGSALQTARLPKDNDRQPFCFVNFEVDEPVVIAGSPFPDVFLTLVWYNPP